MDRWMAPSGSGDTPSASRPPAGPWPLAWSDVLKATETDALEEDACEDDMDTGEEYSYLDRLLTDQQRELLAQVQGVDDAYDAIADD